MTDAARPPAPAYCRQCAYPLRGLPPAARCPECGHPFDLANPRTVARRPPRPHLRRWAIRTSLALALLTTAAACVPAWYYWQWRNEQPAIATLRQLGAVVKTKRVEPAGLGRWMPAIEVPQPE